MSDTEPTAHCMVDLETLGKKPGCVILSIGAQIFDPDAGTLGDTFECKIDWQFSESHYGLTVDPETVAWWNEQSEEARLVLAPGGMDLIAALRAFADFWKRNNIKYFWCHGASFDEPILAEAFLRTQLTPPWEYNGIQCCRTELKRAGVKPDRSAGTHHNALDDARAQALAVIEAGRRRPLIVPIGAGGERSARRAAIFAAVDAERAAQDVQWGGADHDRRHDRLDWLEFIEYQGAKIDHVSETAEYVGRMTKIAALAIAAIEAAPGPIVEVDGVTRWPDGTAIYRIRFDGQTPIYPAAFAWASGATYAHVQAGGSWTDADLFTTEAAFLDSVAKDPVQVGWTRLIAQLPEEH